MTDFSPEHFRAGRSPFFSRPAVQRWAARFFLTRPFVRHEGAEIFRIIQGFIESQMLRAMVDLGLFDRLANGPADLGSLARFCDLPPPRLAVLLQAAVAMRLCRRTRLDHYALTRRGQALLGVPGLADMIRHHDTLYQDLRDPIELLRSPETSALAAFWPYVFSKGTEVAPDEASRYSQLMTDSLSLVAQDTLDLVTFGKAQHVLDIGGGSGAFLCALGTRHPKLRMTLFDLAETRDAAQQHLTRQSMSGRVTLASGSFQTDPLPKGADLITLIRVCYDHSDATVLRLLKDIHALLPAGGRLVISEPMSGGDRPDRITDVYFALYTLAMGTGRTRSAEDIGNLMRRAGFSQVGQPKSRRSYVTTALTGVK